MPAAERPPTPASGAPSTARGTKGDVAEQARAAVEAVAQETIATIVHDLKSPLAIISLESELLARRLVRHPEPAVARGLERILHNAQYVDRLVSELLDLAAFDAGHLQLRKRRIDLPQLLLDTVARAVSSVDRTRVSIAGPDMLFVLADPGRLERVISNLLANALKYSAASVIVRLDVVDSRACVSVIDTGPGLTEPQARSVFERYDRAGDALHEGHGLGLFVSKRIIDAHDGTIGVESVPGQGARFYFELPAVPPPASDDR